MKIAKLIAREIYDSRAWPTIQCDLMLDNGMWVTSSVPAGLSRSSYEAYELRDGGKRLWGMGVLRAVEAIKDVIAPALINKEPNGPLMDITMLDLDGTPNKSKLGANSILAVSMAIYKAQALHENLELFELIAHLMGTTTVTMPFAQFNVINGGLHADNKMQIQEFLLIPVGVSSLRAAMELGVTIYHELKNVLHKHNKSISVGDEGGFAPSNLTDEQALDYLYEAIERVEHEDANNCVIALDIAASQLYDRASNTYTWNYEPMHPEQFIALYENLLEQYPIYSLEDPLAEDDWDHWQQITALYGQDIQIVGDDLFATNFNRIAQGIKDHAATAAVIKLNQIGTVTETLQVIQLCKQYGFDTIISHRSGETAETFIADLAVGTSAGQIKAGGCSRSERLAKYNRLLAIEEDLLNKG